MVGRHLSDNRELALMQGDKRYIGAVHPKCGTSERYVLNSGCVHCARTAASEGREARKLMKAQLEAAADTTGTGYVDETLDNSEEDAYQKSIDDLL